MREQVHGRVHHPRRIQVQGRGTDSPGMVGISGVFAEGVIRAVIRDLRRLGRSVRQNGEALHRSGETGERQ